MVEAPCLEIGFDIDQILADLVRCPMLVGSLVYHFEHVHDARMMLIALGPISLHSFEWHAMTDTI